MNLPAPSPLWQWHFDPEENWLCLSLDDLGTLRTGLSRKNVRDKDFQFDVFSVSDSDCYMSILESLEGTPLLENVRFAFVTCINALASVQFHKEVAAKNWLFDESDNTSHFPQQSQLMNQLASVKTTRDVSDVIIIDVRDNFSTCLLMQCLQLNESKSLPRFSLVKLSISRLFPFTGHSLEDFNE